VSHGTRLFSYEDREEIARLTAALAARVEEIRRIAEALGRMHEADGHAPFPASVDELVRRAEELTRAENDRGDARAALSEHRHAALLAAGIHGGPGAWRWANDPAGTTLTDEAAWERLLGEMRDDSTIAHFAKQWEPPTAERKPVAGWEIGHVPGYSARRAAPILRRGPICVRAGEASWEMIAESDEDDVESIQITRWPAANTLAAQLAAEDALFAIADAINALRGGR